VTVVSDARAREPVTAAGVRARRAGAVAVGVVLALGAVTFTWTRSDMWLDEALSVHIARLPLSDLREALEHDGAPPLYYALLHVWTGVFGDGDLAARSMSSSFGLASLVPIWFGARRLAGTGAAWAAVVVTAANPFAMRYATEARMYVLEILLVACGIVAVPRACERPTAARLGVVALLAALLVFTQYWAFYLLGVVGLALLLRRQWRVAAAVAAGAATFAAWLPTFLSQAEHTGTPWGDPVLPGLPIGETFLGFAGGEEQEGWLLLLLLVPLVVLGVMGRALDDRHVVLDVRTVAEARPAGVVGGATLVAGVSLSWLAGQAFEPRYSAIVFPFFVLLVARGVTTLVDPRVRVAVLAAVVALGAVGGVRNVTEQRTQAGQVAEVLEADARPGDVVAYCPDQLGPAVHRLAPGGLDEVTYPRLEGPARVDWVDYVERVRAADPGTFAEALLARGDGRTIWYVSGPGYPTHAGACEAVADALAAQRTRVPRVAPDEDFFEKPGLVQYPPPAP
jgi:hypothetical protein